MEEQPVFQPLSFLRGGHRQTLAGHLARARLGWHHPSEDVVVEAPDEVQLLLRVSWQPGPRRERPALLLVHGLEGCDTSSYVLSTAEMAFRAGWHVIRMNLRGCGDSLRICPRLYNAGVSEDLLAVLQWTASAVQPVAVCGFSLGANLALLTLARHGEAVPRGVSAAVAVCPPLDLDACAEALARPANRLYQTYFLRRLEASYRNRRLLEPDRYPAKLDTRYRTIRDYDDAITAPLSGYQGATDYYARASAGPLLRSLDRFTLILSAADDPMIPVGSIRHWPLAPSVQHEITPTGGHIGFVGRCRAPGYFWAAERTILYLQQAVV
ncbi:MAG: YheT family hydrolase [Acidobacteriota bacterium]